MLVLYFVVILEAVKHPNEQTIVKLCVKKGIHYPNEHTIVELCVIKGIHQNLPFFKIHMWYYSS